MPGPLLHITVCALLTSFVTLTLALPPRVDLSPAMAHLLQVEGHVRPHPVQELVRPKRHSLHRLVRVQPHLVHDMGWPEIHETTRPQAPARLDAAANATQTSPHIKEVARPRPPAVDDNVDVEDEMERMVHLAVPQESESFRGRPDSPDPDKEVPAGAGGAAGDASQETSGFYGTDMDDRGEDRERRGGEEEEERGGGGDHGHVLDGNHTTPDLDSLIGYSPDFQASSPSVSPPEELQDPGLQEHRGSAVLEVSPAERDLWEVEGEEDGHSSGYELLHSSITPAATVSSPTAAGGGGGDAAGTATPETDTGTDFGLLGSYTKDETEDEETETDEDDETGLTHNGSFTQNPTVAEVGVAPSREPLQPSVEEEEELEEEERKYKGLQDSEEVEEEEKWRKLEEEEEEEEEAEEGTRIRHMVVLTTDPSPTVGFTDVSWDSVERTTSSQTSSSELGGDGVTEKVMCVDWSKLAGSGYVVLNMTHNFNCEEFCADQGVRLLKVMERVFARRMNSPEGSWALYLSKPTHQQHQLLMNVESEHGVIGTKEVLGMLGEIRKNLNQMGIQNYSAASCQSHPSQTRSDYGKLFVVLVIIGSVCMVIITSGFIYICWQRRLPATKTTFRAEELHFVENGCHDNPTLDVTNDNQPEMREKKPSSNGLAGGGEGGGEEGSRWQVFVNQGATEEEEEEQDTHL